MSAGGSDDPSIDTGLVRRLLVEQFPQSADLPLTPVPVPGMDNATYRLGEDTSASPLPPVGRTGGAGAVPVVGLPVAGG
ncbi:hypothetical protein ACWD7C_07065 [Streptomyces sp. NPDC005134]|uniref:hypothetical protein n=1 Tax=unclassified Streptomyces TaxID=2593676 RepID=UPI0033A5811F